MADTNPPAQPAAAAENKANLHKANHLQNYNDDKS